MAISCSCTVNYRPKCLYSLSTLQSCSTFLPFFKLYPRRSSISLIPNSKNHLKFLRKIKATTTLESGNGAVSVSSEGSSSIASLSIDYGRIYFPLAAVVGQVYLSLCSPTKPSVLVMRTFTKQCHVFIVSLRGFSIDVIELGFFNWIT